MVEAAGMARRYQLTPVCRVIAAHGSYKLCPSMADYRGVDRRTISISAGSNSTSISAVSLSVRLASS